MRRPYVVVFLCSVFALPAVSQSVTIGSQSVTAGAALNRAALPYTLIDLSHPASATGSFAYVSVAWAGGSCAAAYKVNFLRPSSPTALGNFTLYAASHEPP